MYFSSLELAKTIRMAVYLRRKSLCWAKAITAEMKIVMVNVGFEIFLMVVVRTLLMTG